MSSYYFTRPPGSLGGGNVGGRAGSLNLGGYSGLPGAAPLPPRPRGFPPAPPGGVPGPVTWGSKPDYRGFPGGGGPGPVPKPDYRGFPGGGGPGPYVPPGFVPPSGWFGFAPWGVPRPTLPPSYVGAPGFPDPSGRAASLYGGGYAKGGF